MWTSFSLIYLIVLFSTLTCRLLFSCLNLYRHTHTETCTTRHKCGSPIFSTHKQSHSLFFSLLGFFYSSCSGFQNRPLHSEFVFLLNNWTADHSDTLLNKMRWGETFLSGSVLFCRSEDFLPITGSVSNLSLKRVGIKYFRGLETFIALRLCCKWNLRMMTNKYSSEWSSCTAPKLELKSSIFCHSFHSV